MGHDRSRWVKTSAEEWEYVDSCHGRLTVRFTKYGSPTIDMGGGWVFNEKTLQEMSDILLYLKKELYGS